MTRLAFIVQFPPEHDGLANSALRRSNPSSWDGFSGLEIRGNRGLGRANILQQAARRKPYGPVLPRCAFIWQAFVGLCEVCESLLMTRCQTIPGFCKG